MAHRGSARGGRSGKAGAGGAFGRPPRGGAGERNEEIKNGKPMDLSLGPGVETEYGVRHQDAETRRRALRRRSTAARLQTHCSAPITRRSCPGWQTKRLLAERDPTVHSVNLKPLRQFTLLGFSRATIDRLTAYKLGWVGRFPYVSTLQNTDFGLRLRQFARPRSRSRGRVRGSRDGSPTRRQWLQVLVEGRLGETQGRFTREPALGIAFRSGGTGRSTPRTPVSAPDPFVAPYFSFLLERTRKAAASEPSTTQGRYPGLKGGSGRRASHEGRTPKAGQANSCKTDAGDGRYEARKPRVWACFLVGRLRGHRANAE